jgi:hypothetical protein
MNLKYEKPSVRNLGAVLNTAQGVCQMGSIAQGLGQDCYPYGGLASDAGCLTGHNPGTDPGLSCDPGITPSTNVGCNSYGYSASLGCTAGKTG